MKQLKCESCGSNLEIDEDKEYAYCEYCRTKYKLNDDLTVNFNLPEVVEEQFRHVNRMNKLVTPIVIVIFLIAAVGIVFGIISAVEFDKEFDKKIQQSDDEFDQMYEGTQNEMLKQQAEYFNHEYESLYNGKTSKFFITDMIDKIITNNQTNKEHLIEVKYGDITSSDPETIRDIKLKLKDKDYEVILSYGDDYYINLITIDDRY